MSNETRSKMEDAMREHFTDETEGSFMLNYSLVVTGVASVSDEPAHAYLYEDGGSPYHVAYGLAMMAIDHITEDHE